MNNSINVEELFQSTLKPTLLELESIRKEILNYFVIGIASGALLFFLTYYETYNTPGIMGVLAIVLSGAAFISLLICLYQGFQKKSTYTNAFKTKIIKEVISAIDPSWKYDHENCISESTYNKSDLFRKNYDKYRGDDLIIGKIESTDFKFSELHTQYKTRSTGSDGKTKTKWHTIFKGVFFHADFNKHFHGKTYISPDKTQGWFGLGDTIEKYTGKAELVKLENVEFEKAYVVHSTDQTEARYILTPAIMEALLRITNKYQKRVKLSFIDSRVYCAIPFHENLFEPNIFSSGVNIQDIYFITQLIEINTTLIHELNLNTRIWTKE